MVSHVVIAEISANFTGVRSLSLVAIQCTRFVDASMLVMMVSFPSLVVGSFVMKSILILRYRSFAMSKTRESPQGF
jgi:hypothetical protein